MPLSEDDYNRYIKPILDRDDIWCGDNILMDIVIHELAPKVCEDNRMDDFPLILMELVKKRKQLLEEHPIIGYTIDFDDDGNPIGEPQPTELWFL